MLSLSNTYWDDQPKGEGGDVQKHGFADSHFVSSLNQMPITQDFNGDLGDFSGKS